MPQSTWASSCPVSNTKSTQTKGVLPDRFGVESNVPRWHCVCQEWYMRGKSSWSKRRTCCNKASFSNGFVT